MLWNRSWRSTTRKRNNVFKFNMRNGKMARCCQQRMERCSVLTENNDTWLTIGLLLIKCFRGSTFYLWGCQLSDNRDIDREYWWRVLFDTRQQMSSLHNVYKSTWKPNSNFIHHWVIEINATIFSQYFGPYNLKILFWSFLFLVSVILRKLWKEIPNILHQS